MSRIVIDPLELAALSMLCRNTSYDAAGIASEMRARVASVQGSLAAAGHPAEATQLGEGIDIAAHALLAVAAQLDDDALLLGAIGQRTEAADAIAEAFGGGEHALLTHLRTDQLGGTP